MVTSGSGNMGKNIQGACVFTERKAVSVVRSGGSPVGSRRRNGSWGATLSHIKDFGFPSINDMESVNNLSR